MVTRADVNRLFLQSILSRRVLTDKLAILIYNKCIDAVQTIDNSLEIPRVDQVDLVIEALNRKLSDLKLEVRGVVHEHSGQRLWVLINVQGDSLAEMATAYKPNEVAFFKAIVEQIMLAKNEAFCIGSTAALREATSMTKAEAQSVLASFVAEGWLLKIRGRYCLATRTVAELELYLKNNYDDIGFYFECVICHSIVTNGFGCCHANCQCRIHRGCYSRMRNAGGGSFGCPSCTQDWSEERNVTRMRSIGEEAFKMGQDDQHRNRPSLATESVDGEGSNNEMEFDDTEEALSRIHRRAAARAGQTSRLSSKKPEEADEDEDED